VKAIKVDDILQSLSPEERPAFIKHLKSEGGVDIRLTAPPDIRLTARRKRKWFVKGKVVGVRFTDEQYANLVGRARDKGLPTVGEYIKWDLFRKRKRGSGWT
jgi:hypothetical protein